MTAIVSNGIPIEGWLGLLLCAMVFLVVYVVALFSVYFNGSEIGLVKSLIGKGK